MYPLYWTKEKLLNCIVKGFGLIRRMGLIRKISVIQYVIGLDLKNPVVLMLYGVKSGIKNGLRKNVILWLLGFYQGNLLDLLLFQQAFIMVSYINGFKNIRFMVIMVLYQNRKVLNQGTQI